ncbi:hypothetical protein [Pontibacter pudoricolor]|uniref:hypothetical protein n=1 Tax=Pontibacter pudoricolor TaxID=2694930 RepID=UPI0013911653|nr:hypothetical protein [Pontibacter pudoricolor]
MLSTLSLLFKALVVQFYKVNAGFFLFVFLVLFGIMDAREIVLFHVSLMQAIVGTVTSLLVALGVWTLYNYKCVVFVLNNLDKPQNIFLVNLQAFSATQQFMAFLFCQLIVYLPVLVYAGFAVSIGIKNGELIKAATIVLFLLLTCFGSAYLYFRKVNSFHKKSMALQLRLPFSDKLSRQTALFLTYHLLHERKLAWVVLKVFSALVFYLVFVTHRDNFSLGYFRLLFLMATIAHSMLVFYSFEFVEKHMAFTRNLPLTRTHRLLFYLCAYLFMLLPEFCWMWVYADGLMSWPEILLTFSAGLGQLFLLTAVLYLPDMNLQRFAWFSCLIYFATAILLPSGITIVLLSEVTVALFVYYRNYYQLES